MSSPTPSPETDSWKRKFEILEAQCAVSKEIGPNVTRSQVSLGRGLRRLVDMFYSARDLVEGNDHRLELMAMNEDIVFTAEQEAMQQSYQELITRVPLVKLLAEDGDSIALEALYNNLRKGSDNARADDAGNLKTAVVIWVNDLYGTSTPALRATSKIERGLENDHTGRLICPAEYPWDDMSIRTHIRDGHNDYAITAQSWPALCYAGLSCDAEDVEKGLFRSALLVKAFKFIFTSPSSVGEDDLDAADTPPPTKRQKKNQTATRSNVALLIGMRTVTPRAIAYIAVQLRFALSSSSAWRDVDIDFSHAEFYHAIVDYFEVTPGPVAQAHVDDLLAWWNRKIFGRAVGSTQGSHRRGGASVSKLAAQRKAREAVAFDS